jgi:soluble lytic murein transglycosylase-like protein
MIQAFISLASLTLAIFALKSRYETKLETSNEVAYAVYQQYAKIASQYVTSNVTLNDILAIISQESGVLVAKGFSNSSIVGDNNTAYGVMQIHEAALNQVNNLYDLQLSINDIANDADKNIQAGSLYLDYCFNVTSGVINQREKAYAMYNGGSLSYSQSALNFYNIFQEK